LTTHLHLAPMLKKEYSYTSTPLWACVSCHKVHVTFVLYLYFCLMRRGISWLVGWLVGWLFGWLLR